MQCRQVFVLRIQDKYYHKICLNSGFNDDVVHSNESVFYRLLLDDIIVNESWKQVDKYSLIVTGQKWKNIEVIKTFIIILLTYQPRWMRLLASVTQSL